jgi:two-component system cell cycle response regulator
LSEHRKRIETTLSAPTPKLVSPRLPFLLVLSGRRVGELHRLRESATHLLGRADACDINIDDDGVSRRHASVEVIDGVVTLRDLDSHNGTWIGEDRILARVLHDGDRIRVGIGADLKFTYADELEAGVQRDLVASAYREPLTNLHNRRYFQEALEAELAAAQRHGRALSLLLFDIDQFKQVNDTYGHGAGDMALRAVAASLQGGVRREDHLARTGGDEFVVLAEADLEGARILAEHLRRAVEATHCPLPTGEVLSITTSVGAAVSAGPPQLDRGHTHQQLYEAADRALYQSKREGRNRWVVTPL